MQSENGPGFYPLFESIKPPQWTGRGCWDGMISIPKEKSDFELGCSSLLSLLHDWTLISEKLNRLLPGELCWAVKSHFDLDHHLFFLKLQPFVMKQEDQIRVGPESNGDAFHILEVTVAEITQPNIPRSRDLKPKKLKTEPLTYSKDNLDTFWKTFLLSDNESRIDPLSELLQKRNGHSRKNLEGKAPSDDDSVMNILTQAFDHFPKKGDYSVASTSSEWIQIFFVYGQRSDYVVGVWFIGSYG
jgi:hypothetical protein